MAAIFNSKMAACWTESDSKSKWIEMLEIRHTWVFSVTSNLRMSRNQWSSYMSVCKIHLCMAAILNSKIVAYCSEWNSRRKWIEVLEIRYILVFSVTSNLQMSQNQGSLYNIWVCKIRFCMAAILNSKMVTYIELNQIPEVNELKCLKLYFISVFSDSSN